MFLGHFGVALAAKKFAPNASLGTLTLAGQWADTLWPALLLAGKEEVKIEPGNTAVTPLNFVSYPYSHSLMALAVWGMIFAVGYGAIRRDWKGASICFGLVMSHWALDWISHRPDMPISPTGGPKVGLGLWASVPATVIVELALLAAGVWLYLASTRARNKVGKWAFGAWVAVLVLIYFANLISPPPPGVQAIAIAGLMGAAIFVAWAAWIDCHRPPFAA